MKRTVCMAAAILCASALATAQSPTTTTASASTTANDKITVSGCLQGGAASSSTTASTSTASSSMSNYVLIPMAADTTAGTAGSTTTTTATTDKSDMRTRGTTQYVLDGRDSELKNHVGHRIEVTGTIGSQGDHGKAATSTTTSGSASTRMNHPTETLKVSSVRMISSSCSAR